jgi:hypothetical protein
LSFRQIEEELGRLLLAPALGKAHD